MAGKKRKPFKNIKKEQIKPLLLMAGVLLTAVVLLLSLPKLLNRSAGKADPDRSIPQESSGEEEEIEVLNVHTENGNIIAAIEHEDQIYIEFEAVNRYYLGEEYFIDTGEGKIFHTTLKGGKTSQPLDDLPVLVQDETVYVPLDWAGETYGFTVNKETELTIVTGPEAKYEEEEAELPAVLPEAPIVLTWFQDFYGTYDEETAAWLENAMTSSNVISPTWFTLQEDGQITSLANTDLVADAHEKGLQVWALFDNGFDDARTQKFLMKEEERDRLIQELLEQCETLGLDGINLDFELLSQQTAPYFIEFVRELSAVLRPAGYIVSIDVHVPAAWSWYYRRDLLGRASNYLIVMAYDEHYAGGEAGSVSSIPFTDQAVSDMLQVVSADKLILGLPFYTRIWYIEGEKTTSEALSMAKVKAYIEENKLEPAFDETTGQNYVSQTVGEILEQIWIEDEASMSQRLETAKGNALAGIACWKAGMEDEEIWPLIDDYRGAGENE